MFVRWKRRMLRGERSPSYVLYAVLVESQRVNGAPRQRVVRHLAHIKEMYLDATAHREWFWQRVDWHLDDLAISPDDRARIEEKLSTTVARPTAEELVELEKDQRALARMRVRV